MKRRNAPERTACSDQASRLQEERTLTTPPITKDRFPYPEDAVVGIAEGEAALTDALRRLEAAGIAGDQVDLMEGNEGADRIDPEGEHHGAAGHRARLRQKFWGYDADNAREYAEQLRGGAHLVAIDVTDREHAVRVGAALHDAGLTRVRYFSRLAVESL